MYAFQMYNKEIVYKWPLADYLDLSIHRALYMMLFKSGTPYQLFAAGLERLGCGYGLFYRFHGPPLRLRFQHGQMVQPRGARTVGVRAVHRKLSRL